MAASKRNPGAGGSGARNNDLSGKAITSETTPRALALQVKIAAFIATIDPALIVIVVALILGAAI